MRFMLVCALALAVGCGGGGGTTMATAQLAGTVYEIDGQRADLAGVQVTLMETGEQAWTDATGAFAFTGLAPGVYRLDFNAPALMALALSDGEGDDAADGDEGEDDGVDGSEAEDDDDGDDDGEDEFEDEEGNPKVDVPEGGSVEILVALENGEVKNFSSDHEDGQHAMARLHLTDAAEIAGYRVEGEVKIAAFADGSTLFKVCVEGLMGGDVIEIFLGDPPTSIRTAEAVEGRACPVLENDLPLDALSLDELAGMLVQVYLVREGDDLKLLVGEVPELIDEQDGENGDGDEADDDSGDEGDDAIDDGEDDGADEGDDPTGDDGEGGTGDSV